MSRIKDALYDLCNEKQYFTHGSAEHYEKMFEFADSGANAHDVAIYIWANSDPKLKPEDIEKNVFDAIDRATLKYELIEGHYSMSKTVGELYQIKALKDIPSHGVRKGDFGGYVSNGDNLSQQDSCWVFPFAMALENSHVMGDAVVDCNGVICRNAVLQDNSRISGDAVVSDDSIVKGNSIINDNAEIEGNTLINNAVIFGDTKVKDFKIDGNVMIPSNEDLQAYIDATQGNLGDKFVTALCGRKYAEAKEILKNPYFDVNIQNGFSLRASMGNEKAVAFLIDHGVDLKKYGSEALCDSCSEFPSLPIAKMLVDHGVDLNEKSSTNLCRSETPLEFAVEYEQTDIAKYLLEHNANVHTDDDHALRTAVDMGNIELTQLLLEHGANIHAHCDFPLRMACENCLPEMVSLLIKNGADVRAENEAPLKTAYEKNNIEIRKIIEKAYETIKEPSKLEAIKGLGTHSDKSATKDTPKREER